ncbi:hypothetical protein CDEST_04366 [Colletotrichum destructivum]|uniref:Uncharacterized protein n=1 Tax=Colletotrichum destructivum TaxID=34406 RepID=A0AAX4I870_9PEZI|nr:hypothetical protein CDEST_04366 [Colletotrichum destructivum]
MTALLDKLSSWLFCQSRTEASRKGSRRPTHAFAPSEGRGISLWRWNSDELKPFGLKGAKSLTSPVSRSSSELTTVSWPHDLVAEAGDAVATVHFWPSRGLNRGIKSGIALRNEIVHELNEGKFVGLPLAAVKQYNDFIMGLEDRKHDKRRIPILNQCSTPETLGWLLSKAGTVPDSEATK